MIINYLMFAIFCVVLVFNIIKAIRKKEYAVLLSVFLFIPFFVFFISYMKFGGSAFNDAASSYLLYQQGHYYLASHGKYTEVTHDVFLYMKIIEVVGIVTFGIGAIRAFIWNIRFKDR